MDSPSIKVRRVRVAVLDTETTGLASDDEPISLGIILLEVRLPKGEIISEISRYYGLRRPTVPINPQAQAIHGISIHSLAGLDFDYSIVCTILDQADYIVAHYAEFDKRMLGKILVGVSDKIWICSVKNIYWSDFIEVTDRKLDTLCQYFNVERESPHNALSDTAALVSVLGNRSGSTNRSRTFLGHALMRAAPIASPVSQIIPKEIPPSPEFAIKSPDRMRREAYSAPWIPPQQKKKSSVFEILFWVLAFIVCAIIGLTRK